MYNCVVACEGGGCKRMSAVSHSNIHIHTRKCTHTGLLMWFGWKGAMILP